MSAEGAPVLPQQTAPQPQSATTLEQLKRMLDDHRTLTQIQRLASNNYRDYYDGKQLNETETKILKDRKQPIIVTNRTRRGVDGVLGVVEQARTDPRAYMRNPPETKPAPAQQQMQPGQPQAPQPELDAADVASMTLRYIGDTNHFKPLKMDVCENFLIEGIGAAITECAGQDVIVTQIRWEEYFYDPRSRRADFADARYQGIAKWMYADQVAALYKEAANDILATASGELGIGIGDIASMDRPTNGQSWVDAKQRRIMVAECYYLEDGKWWRCVFYGNGILEQTVSPYHDDKGKPICPIEAQAAYVDRENNRYGIVKDMIGPQDEINKRRSKLLHLLNVHQIQPIDANTPPINQELARTEAAKPDGVIPPGWKIVDSSSMAQGQAELLAEAKSEIERMGPNPAILGRQGADASGRAQQIRQQAGLTEFARVMGRFTDWELRMYKQMWSRARQFWTDPKWIRVTNDEGAPQYVRINEPDGAEVVPHPENPNVPMLRPKLKNHIAQMDVDIVVDTVPDTATLQQEIFTDFMELAKIYGPDKVPYKVLIQMSALPKKQELIDTLERAQAEAAQANASAIQAQMAEHQANIQETQSNIAKNLSQAGLNEVNTVKTALEAHVTANSAAQLPPGFTLDGQGQHVPIQAPPPPSASGVSGPPGQ